VAAIFAYGSRSGVQERGARLRKLAALPLSAGQLMVRLGGFTAGRVVLAPIGSHDAGDERDRGCPDKEDESDTASAFKGERTVGGFFLEQCAAEWEKQAAGGRTERSDSEQPAQKT
jgi:hypothetical protein